MLTVPVALALADEYRPNPPEHPLRGMPNSVSRGIEQLPNFELLGTPEVRTLLGYTRRPLHFPDGHTMGLFSFSYSTTANWLYLVDCRDLTFERFDMPNNDNGSHCAAMTPDGNIYFMPYATGRAYVFRTGDRMFEQLETEVPQGEYTWDALGASNGRVYFGTYPNAYFGEYDPVSGEWTLRKNVVANTKYVTGFQESPQGVLKFKAWGPDEVWLSFDLKTRELGRADPPAAIPLSGKDWLLPEGDTQFAASIEWNGRWYAISNPTGRFWQIVNGMPELRGETGFPAEPTWWLKTVDDGIAGVSYFGGMFRYEEASGAFKTDQLNNRAPGGNAIMFIESITPDCVVGANYSQQNLFTINPNTGAIRESGSSIARTSGEPMCAIGFGGKAYLGIYTGSLISVFDPKEPFRYGVNPLEIAALGKDYAQTRPRAAVTDGKLVYITSDSEYNKLGGALAVVDPSTASVDVYHHLIPDQNLPSLAYDPVGRLLWGGTDKWGQMRSHPPTQPSALIYAFDPESRKVVHRLEPWPNADVVTVHGVLPGGVVVASNADEIAVIDAVGAEVLYKGVSPIGIPGRIRIGADGRAYCLARGVLYQWESPTNTLRPVATAIDARDLTETSPGTWLLATPTSVLKVRVSE